MITIDGRDLDAHVRSLNTSVFKAILDALPDYIFIKDTESRFLYSNLSHLQHLGLPEAQLIGKNDLELYPPEISEPFYADETRLFGNRMPVVKLERSVTVKNEHIVTFTVKRLIGTHSGTVLGLMGIARRIAKDDRNSLLEAKDRTLELLKNDIGPDVKPSQLHALEASLKAMIESSDLSGK